MHYTLRIFIVLLLLAGFTASSSISQEKSESNTLAQEILANPKMEQVLSMAKEIVRSGFSAGDGYEEIWIRDLNTFIELACQVHEKDVVKEKLLLFFHFQGSDGNIIDGYLPATQARHGYNYILSESAPDYRAHKNTVETDQESSLIQAVYKYVQATQDTSILQEIVAGKTVLERMELALQYLLDHRFSEDYGLIWGATTVDWGDVQPEHEWGVVLDDQSHRAIDIYDNALFLIAISSYLSLQEDRQKREHWQAINQNIWQNVREHLWEEHLQKFIPHIYLEGSPFPDHFDESQIYYHGGTAVAVQAGLLSAEEIEHSLQIMKENAKKCGAATIGLTVYPPYPDGFFKNPSMRPYSYQNGGDWTWFGGRMIQGLIAHGFITEAYREMQPMLDRVIQNKGFYEWYDIYNKPRGSGTYRGSAGVLSVSIQQLQSWAEKHK